MDVFCHLIYYIVVTWLLWVSRPWCCIFIGFKEWFKYWDWVWFEKIGEKSEHLCLILIMAIYYLLFFTSYYYYYKIENKTKISISKCFTIYDNLQLLIKILIILSHQHLSTFVLNFSVFEAKIPILVVFFLLMGNNSM